MKILIIEKPAQLTSHVINQAKANYQTAYDLFKSGGLHQ